MLEHIELLEISNFKSYKGCQLIGPFKNFTAIIGPNGAGKSNLMDAISFVFGIRAASLRGSQLSDLIYKSSSDLVQDQSAALAIKSYVKLVLVSPDESKIQFQRNIRSTTSSDYMINSVSVSWEEYQAHLAKFNILVKAKNFLVFQGSVESIAQKSPKELTDLLEHVSGSLDLKPEYDRLALERDKAIENAQFTFKKQKGIRIEKKQYHDQHREAERFTRLQHQLTQLDMKQLIFQLFYIDKDMNEAKASRQSTISKLKDMQLRQTEHASQLNTKARALAKMNQTLSAIQRNMEVKQSKLDKLRSSLMVTQKEGEHLSKREEANRRSLDLLVQARNKHLEKLKVLELELDQVKAEESRYLAEQDQVALACEKVHLNELQLEEWRLIKDEARLLTLPDRQRLEQVQRQQEVDLSLHQVLENQKLNHERRLTFLEEEQRRECAEKMASLHESIKEKLEQIRTIKTQLESIENETHLSRAREETLNQELEQVQDELKQGRVSINESNQRHRMEECLVTLKRLFGHVYGRVIDLVQPTAPKYRIVLTVVLGQHMDSIIVADQKTALECIQYMKEQRVGVATFLPLDQLQVERVNEVIRTWHPDIKLVSDVLHYEAKYERAIQYICGNTIVCPDLDTARHLAFGNATSSSLISIPMPSIKCKVATLDGTLISKSGLMTGGLAGIEDRSRRWDLKDIEKLKKRREQLTLELADLVYSNRHSSHQPLLQTSLAQLESQVSTLQFDYDSNQKQAKQIEKDVETVKIALAKLNPEYAKLNRAIEKRQVEIDSLKQAILKGEDSLYLPFAKLLKVPDIRQWDEHRAARLKQQATILLQFTSQRARIQNLIAYERPLVDAPSDIHDLETRIQADVDARSSIQHNQNLVQEQVNQLTTECHELKSEVGRKRAMLAEQQVELNILNKDHEVLQQLVSQLAKQSSAKEAMMDQLREKRHQLYLTSVQEELQLPLVGESSDLLHSLANIVASDPPGGDAHQRGDEAHATSTPPLPLSQVKNQFLREDTIHLDFKVLDDKLCGLSTLAQRDEQMTRFHEERHDLSVQLDKIAPNLKASEHLELVNRKMDDMQQTLDEAKATARRLISEFDVIREERQERFIKAFNHISRQIDVIYKGLTNQFGVAHLTLDSNDEPYLHATRFSAIPPYKMYHEIEDLSGGEKSMAALALLFAIHHYRPSPFLILDEIDAALDSTNVQIIAQYFRQRSQEIQFILISLKDRCFDHANSLIGVYIDHQQESSKTLTLDLSPYE